MGTRPRTKFVLAQKARRCGKCGAKLHRSQIRCRRCAAQTPRPKK